jgi:hypothetical protein
VAYPCALESKSWICESFYTMLLETFKISPSFKFSDERVVDFIKTNRFFQWSLYKIPDESDFITEKRDLNKSTSLIM